MSFYGGIKRIDDTVFKFDKIYRTRKDMDQNAQSDGVYIGRYVLIEYGERYYENSNNAREENSFNNVNNNDIERIEKLLIKGLDFYPTKDIVPEEGKIYYTLKENNSGRDLIDLNNPQEVENFNSEIQYYELRKKLYKENREEDQNEYKDTFDSTVWIKIFNGSIEKYIMVAELNAMIPKMTLIPTSSLRYLQATDEEEEEVYNRNNEKIENVKSEFISPSFDQHNIDTELEYKLYMPKPLELDVQDKNVEYNKLGFDIAYSNALVKEINGEEKVINNNFIHWVPILDNQNALSHNNIPAEINRKELYMSLPGIGNLMKDLYDLLYGKPRENHNVRPFFKEYHAAAGDYEGQARTYNNDDEAWLANVPTIGDILANNTTGLAGILSHLFAIRNPYTGTVTFYLRTDWNALLDDSSDPCISGKPYVITKNVKDNEDYPGDYKINYTGWNLELC